MITERARHWIVVVAISATVAAIAASTAAMASEGNTRVDANSLHEHLTGYAENPLALSTTGDGQFDVQISEGDQEISYQLSYTGLVGAVTQAHIHFGSQSQVGGVSVFLCTNLNNSPVATQACPPAPATISGTIRPGDVIGPGAQGITAGEFAELIAAIRGGATYVNVHSTVYPVGEIRAQLGH